jgi:HSP20 family protein
MAEKTDLSTKSPAAPTVPETTHGGPHFVPRVDIIETDKHLIVYADLPGVAPQDVDLRYERGELILHGRVKPRTRTGTRLLEEYDIGDFYRAFQVHESIDASKIEAECKNGVLIVYLPKEEAAQPKKVVVKAS